MQLPASLLAWSLALSSISAVTKQTPRRNLQMQYPCLLLLKHIMYEDGRGEEYWDCQMQGSDRDAMGPMIVSVEGISEMAKKYNVDMISGETTLFVPGAVVDNDVLNCPKDATPVFGQSSIGGNRRLSSGILGSRTVLALRVETPDATLTENTTATGDSIFGTLGDPVNLATQLDACSHGRFRIIPTPDPRAQDGVFSVQITQAVGVRNDLLRNEANSLATSMLGDLRSQFDHVMFCLPPGTDGGWIAYAYANHYISVYNDRWCNYVSTQMHELGHNFGLSHSNEGGVAYADQTGYMGYSYARSDWPRMCFNGQKSWRLGWYSDRSLTVDLLTSSWSGQLVGMVDYANVGDRSILVLLDGDPVYDYVIAFNRQRDFNEDTRDGLNQVLITRRERAPRYANSDLVAKLATSGDEFRLQNFGNTTNDVTVTVNFIEIDGDNPGYADITVVGLGTETPPPRPIPTPQPTFPPTLEPTRPPTPPPSPVPTAAPTSTPTAFPTSSPTLFPTPQPTAMMTPEPTLLPTPLSTLHPQNFQIQCTCRAPSSSS